jgi:hypothetical protein
LVALIWDVGEVAGDVQYHALVLGDRADALPADALTNRPLLMSGA